MSKRTTIDRVCEKCKKIFETTFQSIKRDRWKFCSKECFLARDCAVSVERFFGWVNKNGPIPPHCPELGPCWLWTGKPTNPQGYGAIYINEPINKSVKAHRISWELTYGPIPDNLHCLHKCDVRLCVKPEHLFLGTNQDNVDDMLEKGRGRKAHGEEHVCAVLTERDVLGIRSLYAIGDLAQHEIGKLFNINQSRVSKIIRLQNWKHVIDQTVDHVAG